MDKSVEYMRNFIMGGNKEGYHYKNVNLEDLHYDISRRYQRGEKR